MIVEFSEKYVCEYLYEKYMCVNMYICFNNMKNMCVNFFFFFTEFA